MRANGLLHRDKTGVPTQEEAENSWKAPVGVQAREENQICLGGNTNGGKWKDLRPIYKTHGWGRKSK